MILLQALRLYNSRCLCPNEEGSGHVKVIREDSTWSDPGPGHIIVTHFQAQGHHLEV